MHRNKCVFLSQVTINVISVHVLMEGHAMIMETHSTVCVLLDGVAAPVTQVRLSALVYQMVKHCVSSAKCSV